MAAWQKRETEAGFPYYIREDTNARQWSHPTFVEILERVNQLSDIKYAIYRMAYKIKTLQDYLKVPCIRIISGVFSHHCLSISESSLALEPCELEAILTDIYFAAQKEGTFSDNIDTATDVLLSFILNVYDSDRAASVGVQAAKIVLAILCDDGNAEKWKFLFTMMADHNGCISSRKLTNLLTQIALLAEYVGEQNNFGLNLIQGEVDKCFAKTPGMLGLSEHELFQWLESSTPPSILSWMEVRLRLQSSSTPDSDSAVVWKCAICDKRNPVGLKFKCTRCWGMLICEHCYLFSDMKPVNSNVVYKHKKSHIVKEIIHSQGMPSKRVVGFMKNMKRALNCPFYCSRTPNLSNTANYSIHPDDPHCASNSNDIRDKKITETNDENRKPKVYTSTVGKAKGNTINDPKIVLQDIISQLENQNRALKNLSVLLNDAQNVNSVDRRIQNKVDSHWSQIAAQINRLKVFKENILPAYQTKTGTSDSGILNNNFSQNKTVNFDKSKQMRVFEAFSPIPVKQRQCMTESSILEQKKLGENHQNIVNKNLDSISNVSMSDISTWFVNEPECDKQASVNATSSKMKKCSTASEQSTSEEKFNADIESVATSNNKMKELNADLDSVLDRLQTILANNFALDEACFDNSQLQETANEMEGLLGTLIRGVEQRRTVKGDKI